MSNCSRLSSLALSIHGLPNVSNVNTDTLFVTNSDGELVALFTADLDTFIRTWFWGAFIVVLTAAVLYAICFYYCCVCCCFCCETEGKEKKPRSRGLKFGCGLVNIILIVCALVLVCVSVWFETDVSRGVTDGYSHVLNLIANSSDDYGASELTSRANYFERFGFYRFRVALGYFGFVLLMLVLYIIAVTLASAYRTAGAVIVSIFNGLFAGIAFLTSMLAGVTFTSLIYYSDLCVDLYAVGGNSLCTDPNFDSFIGPLHTFCNDIFTDNFTLVMLGCAVVFVFILLQIFSVIYAASLTGKEKSRYLQTSDREIVISSPIMASGVWSSYGAKTVLGVKSQGQAVTQRYPPPYPLDTVSPDGTRRMSGQNGVRSPVVQQDEML